jgi:hypothetical protein
VTTASAISPSDGGRAGPPSLATSSVLGLRDSGGVGGGAGNRPVTVSTVPSRLMIKPSQRQVTPFRVSILRGCRAVLYAGSSAEWIPYTNVLYGLKTFPVLGPAVCLEGQIAVRQVLHDDASTTASLSLSIATCLGRHRFRLAVYPLPTLALRRLMTSLPP